MFHSYYLSNPFSCSLRKVIRCSLLYTRGGREPAAPLPNRDVIQRAMVEVDAQRRAMGLPVPQSSIWTKLRRKWGNQPSRRPVTSVMTIAPTPIRRPEPATIAPPVPAKRNPVAIVPAAKRTNGGLRGSTATTQWRPHVAHRAAGIRGNGGIRGSAATKWK